MKLRLTRRTTVVDDATGERYVGPGVHTIADERAEELLADERGLWRRVDHDDTDAGAGAGDDLAALLDEHWQTVVSDIRAGAFDDQLDALEQAERGRDGVARESVLEAIDERR